MRGHHEHRPTRLNWATHRRPWQDRDVAVEGDTEAAARVLDAIHVF
jgi:hypothetical protein